MLIKIKHNSPLNRESILLLHIFCECEIATSIWDSVVERYNSFDYNLDYLSNAQIIFGDPSFDPIFNRIILITKVKIFKNKTKNRRVLLGAIIQTLKYQFHIEKFIATKSGRLKTLSGLQYICICKIIFDIISDIYSDCFYTTNAMQEKGVCIWYVYSIYNCYRFVLSWYPCYINKT